MCADSVCRAPEGAEFLESRLLGVLDSFVQVCCKTDDITFLQMENRAAQ